MTDVAPNAELPVDDTPFARLSATDHKLVTPHIIPWNAALSRILPDTILTMPELEALIDEKYFGKYRGSVAGALVRYSLARGDLAKLGTSHYYRVGLSRESGVELAQLMGLGGWLAFEFSPGTVLGYEDVVTELGDRQRRFRVFARRAGETFRWIIASVPVIVALDSGDEPIMDADAMSMIARRLELLNLM